jgi:Zn-dependent M16 (insulinase) family peptidase
MIVTNTILHREVREKGGAYGSGIKTDRDLGLALMFSYRDPNSSVTFERFRESV